MPTTFRPYEPDQLLLLAPDVRDWLPEGHFAHHVSDLVDGLDLRAFYAPYEGDSHVPYEPRMMVKVLLYGYATGVLRGMARKLEEDVAFRVLGAGNFPSHRTLCEFRRRHLEEFKGLFVEVVRLAREAGLLSFGKLSIDGTKVRANASKRKAMSYGRMRAEERRLQEEIEALLKQARDTDAEEDARFGESLRGDELPEELRRRADRLAAIVAAKARLEAAQREADDARGRQPEWERNPRGGQPYKRAYGEPEDKSNFTDPDSAIMKTGAEGFQQCYNAQVAVDGEHRLVVATELTSNASDQGKMMGLLDEVKETFDAQPETVLPATAMSGTCRSSKRGVSTGVWRRGGRGKRQCAATRTRTRRHTGWSRSWRHQRGGSGTRNASGCAQWLEVPGFRRFSVRGLNRARGEWDLVCLALNIKRLQPLLAGRRLASETWPESLPSGVLPDASVPLEGTVRHCALRRPCPSSHQSRPVHPLACPVFLQRKLLGMAGSSYAIFWDIPFRMIRFLI